VTSVDAEANFTPAEEANPVTRLRDRAAMAREDHHARMSRGSDFVIAVVRPRWVIILGVTAATQRKADHWQAACNLAFAAVLLFTIARGILGRSVLMAVLAIAATLGVMKLIRIQISRPYGEETTTKQDKGYEAT
jgi:hypothetical protein